MTGTDLNKIIPLVIIVYCVCAVFSTGYLHPDEHFQILEAANFLVNGVWFKSWEWSAGMRSWFLPMIYAIPLIALKTIGITSAAKIAMGLRFFTMCFAFIKLIFFYKILEIIFASRRTRLAVFSLYALFWHSPFLAVRTSSENWGEIFIVIALYFVLKSEKNDWNRRHSVQSGVFAGLAFMARFQMAIMFAGFAMVLILKKQWRSLLHLCAGFLLIFIFQGILDLVFYGEWWAAPIHYANANLFANGAAHYFGASPLGSYLAWFVLYFGGPIAIVFLIMAGRGLFDNHFISVPAVLFVIVHCLLSHKEFRFLIPAFPFIYLLIGMGAQKYSWEKFSGKKYVASGLIFLNFALLAGLIHFRNVPIVSILNAAEDHAREHRLSKMTLLYESSKPRLFPVFYASTPLKIFYSENADALEADGALFEFDSTRPMTPPTPLNSPFPVLQTSFDSIRAIDDTSKLVMNDNYVPARENYFSNIPEFYCIAPRKAVLKNSAKWNCENLYLDDRELQLWQFVSKLHLSDYFAPRVGKEYIHALFFCRAKPRPVRA